MNAIATPATIATAIDHLVANDARLSSVIASIDKKPSITPHKNYYQELVESIVSQQLSVKAAATILKRFIALFPEAAFPRPEQILQKDVEAFRSVGLSRQKATYIQDLAVKVIEGTVQFDHLDSLSNDDVISELTQIKGVGIWTVHMFLIFCMGRLDVLPTGDLGIKNGIQKLYALDERPTPEIVEAIAQEHNWHPYESVASWYVWQSLDNMPALEAE